MITAKRTIIGHLKDGTPWRIERGALIEEIVSKYTHNRFKFCDIKLSDGKILQHVFCVDVKEE